MLVGRPQNYVPHRLVRTFTVHVAAGEKQWVTLPLSWDLQGAQNAFVVLRANPQLQVHTADGALPGVLTLTHRDLPPEEAYTEQWREWKQVLQRGSPCLRLLEPTEAFAPERAVGGYARPWGGPQMWISQPLAHDPQPQLDLVWDEPVTVAEVAAIFDDDLEEDLINLHHHRTPFDVLPTLVRDYRLEARTGGRWQAVAQVTGNRHRHRRHRLPEPIEVDGVRLVVEATNGAESARVVALRAWGS